MFDRWKKTHKAVYEVESENLAVPEVHTGKVRHEAADSTPEADCPIHYDNVAIPEIHIHPRKK